MSRQALPGRYRHSVFTLSVMVVPPVSVIPARYRKRPGKPSLAGPKRPQDRVALKDSKPRFLQALDELKAERNIVSHPVSVNIDGKDVELDDGSVVIAAITCGINMDIGCPSMAASASIPPTPQPSTPRPIPTRWSGPIHTPP